MVNHFPDEDIKKELDNVLYEDKKDIIIIDNNTIYEITTTKNQKNHDNKNISTIDLGECENILKTHYNINPKDSLLILKADIYKDNYLIPIVQYQIFNPINRTLVDLNLCKDTKITLDIPVSINEDELYKYDQNSDYYNDRCFVCFSDNQDMTINDRREEFIKQKRTLCGECKYINYNKETKSSKCECDIDIKNEITIFEDLTINKERLYDNFIGKTGSNLEVIKCYYLLFQLEYLIKNIGNYLILFLILSYLICTILFCVKGYKSLFEKIDYLKGNFSANKICKKNINKKKIKSFRNKIINLTKGKKSSGNKNPTIKIN